MKFKFLAKTVALITTFLGTKDIPINAEEQRSDFSEEQIAQLKEKFGEEFTLDMISAVDNEIKELHSSSADLKAIQDEIAAFVAEKQNKEDLEKPSASGGTVEGTEDPIAQLKKMYERQEEMIQTLINEPESDNQTKTTTALKNTIIQHSATHLFSTGKQYDAFENRPWNARLRDASMKATDFKSDGKIPLLENDMEHFVRENPEVLNSLFNDFADLPKQWSRRTGILDRVSDGFIIPAEIVQGRSKGWNPKNKFKISAEEGRVFAKKIDVEFDGAELQKIETSWIRNYNREGSHPYKMTFIFFLLSELVKRQMLDDRKAQINGIYVPTPDGDGFVGKATNSQDGLLVLFHRFRDVQKKYRAFDIGKPTKENIVDYVKTMIELLPEEERTIEGLEIGLSSEKLQWYRERAGVLYQHLASVDSGKLEYRENHPIDYPNIIFQPLKDMTKTDFIYITESENIEIMDYDTSEKGKFTVEHLKRSTYIFADYRLGIRLKFVGMKLEDGDPREFEVQKVWSNNVPIFSEEVKAPVFDDKTGILKIKFQSVKVDETFSTDITSVEGGKAGQVIKISGNKNLVAVKNLKKNTNLVLASDYPLNTEGTIVLLVQADGKLKELTRTTSAPDVLTQENKFETEILDVKTGSEFYFTGLVAETLESIINGVENKTIRIYGSEVAENTLTISSNLEIKVNSTAVLAKKSHFVELVNVSGIWYETNRSIS